MISIIKVKVLPATLYQLMKTDRAAVTALREAANLRGSGDYFVSDPMLTTSQIYALTKPALERLGLAESIEDLTTEYRICRTLAPKDYDYAYCVDVAINGKERTVAIPVRSYDYQTGRYASGNYTAAAC